MRESAIQSRKSGEKHISPNAVRKVTEVRGLIGSSRACDLLPYGTNDSIPWLLENPTEIQRLAGRPCLVMTPGV